MPHEPGKTDEFLFELPSAEHKISECSRKSILDVALTVEVYFVNGITCVRHPVRYLAAPQGHCVLNGPGPIGSDRLIGVIRARSPSKLSDH